VRTRRLPNSRPTISINLIAFATIGRIHRRLCLASRAQRLHGIHALAKEFRYLGPVPIARRKVIAALGGTAVAWPLTWPRAACARQPERMRRIGVLMPFSADDQEVTAVDPSAAAAPPDKRLSPGDVIVEVQYQSVGNPADLQNRVDQTQEAGRRKWRCSSSPTPTPRPASWR
jgi:hypothetical protein